MFFSMNFYDIESLVIEEVERKMRKKKTKKSPWIAALLNFLFYGAGYIYAGKKKSLGYGLILVFIISKNYILD